MLSIVIPTRNRSESLERLVRSIERYTDRNYELIVVENDHGLNEKINEGLLLSTGEHIAILHDDIEVTDGWSDILPHSVGAFKVNEKGAGVTCWGGLNGGYCTDKYATPDYSAFLMLTREALARIGLTDPAYKEPGYQDADYGKQISQAGYLIECLPGELIHHHLRTAPLSAENERYFRQKWS